MLLLCYLQKDIYLLKFNYTDDQSKELNIYTSIKKRYLSYSASLYRMHKFEFEFNCMSLILFSLELVRNDLLIYLPC